MLRSYPFVPVVGSVRIVVAIFSYNGGLYFGVTGDYDGAPDIDVLTAGIAERDGGAPRDRGPAPAPPAPTQQARGAAGTRRAEPPSSPAGIPGLSSRPMSHAEEILASAPARAGELAIPGLSPRPRLQAGGADVHGHPHRRAPPARPPAR